MSNFKGKQFEKDIIIVAVGYYLRYNVNAQSPSTYTPNNLSPIMDLSYLVVFAYCLAHVACARGCQGKSSSNASLETCARLGMRSNRNSK